jgi:hypothetical protein
METWSREELYADVWAQPLTKLATKYGISVQLNGKTLQLTRDGDVPQFLGQSTRTGQISFAPTSITFLEITNADNSNCY